MSSKKENFLKTFHYYFRKEEALYIPNVLCYLRIIFTFLFLAFYLIPEGIYIEYTNNPFTGIYLSCAMMVLASYTDFLDGFIARKYKQSSHLGRILDPIADKLLQFIVAIGLCVKFYMYPVVFIMLAIFVLKEALQAVELIYLATKKRSLDHAEWYGKLTTFIFYLILGTLLVGSPFIFEYCGEAVYNIVINVLCSIAIALLFFALVMYLIDGYKILKKKEVKDD